MAGPAPIEIVQRHHFRGHVKGLRQPSFMATVRFADAAMRPGLLRRLAGQLAPLAHHRPDEAFELPTGAGPQDFVRRFLDAAAWLQTDCGAVVADHPLIELVGPAPRVPESQLWRCYLPGVHPEAARLALRTLIDCANACLAAEGDPAPAIARLVERCRAASAPHELLGVNTPVFASIAFREGVPMIQLPSGVMQFGWGSAATLLFSTATETTPALALKLARSKLDANRLMAAAGIPVPRQQHVTTLAQAEKAAEAMGYPVVVKPAAEDGGRGVHANLEDVFELQNAVERAQKVAKALIVEEHVEGGEYRFTVIDDEFVDAFQRFPPGVWGDGSSSVQALIDAENARPERDSSPMAVLKPLEVVEETHDLLAKAGLSLDSVPGKGVFVRLRRSSNVSNGGSLVDVTDKTHPENRDFLRRIARCFRLDVTGIDIIMSDVARPWYEGTCAVIDVNGQPQFNLQGYPRHEMVLHRSLAGTGRIPVAIVAGGPALEGPLREFCAGRAAEGPRIGLAAPSAAWLGERFFARGLAGPFEQAQALLREKTCDGLVVLCDPRALVGSGMPVDRADMVLVGPGDRYVDDAGRAALALLAAHADSPLRVGPEVAGVEMAERFEATPEAITAALGRLFGDERPLPDLE